MVLSMKHDGLLAPEGPRVVQIKKQQVVHVEGDKFVNTHCRVKVVRMPVKHQTQPQLLPHALLFVFPFSNSCKEEGKKKYRGLTVPPHPICMQRSWVSHPHPSLSWQLPNTPHLKPAHRLTEQTVTANRPISHEGKHTTSPLQHPQFF